MKKNKLILLTSIILFVTTALFFSGCYEHEEVGMKNNAAHKIDTSDPLYQYITKDLGFDPKDVKDLGSLYMVEGDMMFRKEGYAAQGNSSGRDAQYVATSMVTRPNQSDITISVDTNIPTSGSGNWRPQILLAVVNWNSVTCSNIRFRFVGRTGGRIHIKNDSGELPDSGEDGFAIAAAQMPSGGLPGSLILLNASETPSAFDKQMAVAHELGHTIGFRHTNWISEEESELPAGAHFVPNSLETDITSVMNQHTTRNVLSANDIIALEHVYPTLTKRADTDCRGPLYRYFSSNQSNHYYTTEFTDLGRGALTYQYTWIECHIYNYQADYTIPLYRYWNNNVKDHYYTVDFNELGNGKNGYTYQRIEGYAYLVQLAGTIPLYKYYHAQGTDHFYTVDWGELGSGKDGFVYLGVACYVYP